MASKLGCHGDVNVDVLFTTIFECTQTKFWKSRLGTVHYLYRWGWGKGKICWKDQNFCKPPTPPPLQTMKIASELLLYS